MRLLVAVDRSIQAQWAVQVAANLAWKVPADVLLMNVFLPPSGLFQFPGNAERQDTAHYRGAVQLLERTRGRFLAPFKCAELVREGVPADEIIATAKNWNADLIILGAHSRGRLGSFFLGSTADAVLRKAPCPVMTVGCRPKVRSRPKTKPTKRKLMLAT